ncbi:hypothetical protein [Vannielia litorea]|uniref:hypothetical protein n=1 Tax=Vannielia litorea TaxID=1217970 RepID=UPI00111516CF|nr:hypothetical protein [Vannielia litorea]
MKRIVPFGGAIVSKAGFERTEVWADDLRHDAELSNPTAFPAREVFVTDLGNDMYENGCSIEWTVWLDESGDVESSEILLHGSADMHRNQIFFKTRTSDEER